MSKFIVDGKEFIYNDFVKVNSSFGKIFGFRPFQYQNVEITEDIFPVIVVSCLKKAHCKTMCDLSKWSPARLAKVRNIDERRFIATVTSMVDYCSSHTGDEIKQSATQNISEKTENGKKILADNIAFEYKTFKKDTRSFAEIFNIIPYHYRNVHLTADIFPTIIFNSLTRSRCATIADLLNWSPCKLSETNNIGEKWFTVTIEKMQEFCKNNKGERFIMRNNTEYPAHELETLKIDLANNIRNWRKWVGITQEQFALGCGLDLEIIKQIESCTIDAPLSILKKVSVYIACSVPDLLTPNKF